MLQLIISIELYRSIESEEAHEEGHEEGHESGEGVAYESGGDEEGHESGEEVAYEEEELSRSGNRVWGE